MPLPMRPPAVGNRLQAGAAVITTWPGRVCPWSPKMERWCDDMAPQPFSYSIEKRGWRPEADHNPFVPLQTALQQATR